MATTEVVEAQLWYEGRAKGLGDRFLQSLDVAMARAASWPNSGAPARGDDVGAVLERQVRTPGFPFVVVYRTTSTRVEVLAVHHEQRRPSYWADRAE
jgi:hypothetical protein